MSEGEPSSVWKMIILIFIAVLICFLNVVLIYLVSRQKMIRSRINYMVIALAVSDILFGGIAIPMHILADSEIFGTNLYACLLTNSVQMPLSLVSLLFLIMMAGDRLIAITHPLHYGSILTSRRLAFTIGAVWFYGLICALLPVAGWNNFELRFEQNSTLEDCNFASIMDGRYVGFYVLGHFFPAGVFMLALYVKIFLATRSHCRKICTVQMLHIQSELAKRLSTERKHRTTSKIIVVLGSFFLLFFSPLMVAFTIDYDVFTVRLIEKWKTPYSIYVLGTILACLNPIFNPLFLGFTNKHLRKSIIRLVRGKREPITINQQCPNLTSAAEVTWCTEKTL